MIDKTTNDFDVRPMKTQQKRKKPSHVRPILTHSHNNKKKLSIHFTGEAGGRKNVADK